ncbi:hypothetical protein ACFORL_06625 [Legionella dresdenensis]|uniref:Leucine-rich repeat-containing protein (Substrate of the Dot/Icm secretion system) n=1 Tax=Legionella dresdenensis TaxID=450200 RepID=A0ABV8CFG1_9GAMM
MFYHLSNWVIQTPNSNARTIKSNNDIFQEMELIPTQKTGIIFRVNDLADKNLLELAQIAHGIPQHIRQIVVVNDNLQTTEDCLASLWGLLSYLPPWINKLDISAPALYSESWKLFVKLIAQLPNTVSALSFGCNALNSSDCDNGPLDNPLICSELTRSIPASVNHLSIRCTAKHLYTLITGLFRHQKNHITSLDISENKLTAECIMRLTHLFSHPHTIDTLDLSQCRLEGIPSDILARFFETLHGKVTNLKLNYNRLIEYTVFDFNSSVHPMVTNFRSYDEIHHQFSFFSRLKMLGLAGLQLGFENPNVSATIFGLLGYYGNQLEELDLSSNDFSMNTHVLLPNLKRLPASLYKLNLSFNRLDAFSDQELIALLLALPQNIKILDLSNNNLLTVRFLLLLQNNRVSHIALTTLIFSETSFENLSTDIQNAITSFAHPTLQCFEIGDKFIIGAPKSPVSLPTNTDLMFFSASQGVNPPIPAEYAYKYSTDIQHSPR